MPRRRSSGERLDSLVESFLSALRGELVDYKLVERREGRYFISLHIKTDDTKVLPVMIIVQGLEPEVMGGLLAQLTGAGKRALEDFIVFAARDYLRKIPGHCLSQLLAASSKAVHKKIAYLVMIYLCEVKFERFIFRVVNERSVAELIEHHDGLKMIAEIVKRILAAGNSV